MSSLLKTSILTSSGEVLKFVESLNIAVYSDFMSREHAGQIWKQLLKNSGMDIVRKIKTKEEVKI